MRDARSMSRNEFTKVKLLDPRIAMNEIPQKIAKERRVKIIQDNIGSHIKNYTHSRKNYTRS